MKRAKIGTTDIPVEASYWTGGKRSPQLRQSEKELYSQLNLLQENAGFSGNEDEIDEIYTEMDKLYIAIQLIMNFGDDDDLLLRAGVVYSDLLHSGKLQQPYESLDERNAAVNEIATGAIAQVADVLLSETVETETLLWWRETVLEQNFFWNEATGEKTSIPGDSPGAIGAVGVDEYSKQLVEGGMFYVYMIADSRLIDTADAIYKKSQQNITLDRLEATGVGLSRNVMMNNIKTGILRQSGGKSASEVVQDMRNGEAKIGELVLAIIGAVVAIVALVTAIVQNSQKAKELRIAEIMSTENMNVIAPKSTDFPGGVAPGGISMNSLGNIGGIPVLPLVLGVGALLLITK